MLVEANGARQCPGLTANRGVDTFRSPASGSGFSYGVLIVAVANACCTDFSCGLSFFPMTHVVYTDGSRYQGEHFGGGGGVVLGFAAQGV